MRGHNAERLDPKHTIRASHEFLSAKKWSILKQPSQSLYLNQIQHAFNLPKTELKTELPTNKP